MQCKKLLHYAWISIPEGGTPNKYFTQIPQGPTESYTEFVAQLQEAINRQISHNITAKMLICQSAYENVSDECKGVLASVPHTKDLSAYIFACQNIRSTVQASALMAQTVSQNLEINSI